jgi:SAM-dependent methyltransferase
MPHPRLSETVLRRAAALLRPPGGGGPLEPLSDGSGWRDPATGRRLRPQGGVLDLLGGDFAPTPTQRMLDTRATAWLYDRVRDAGAPLIGMPTFAAEVDDVAERLALVPGMAVLDVACGHGNFTVEIARRVGPEGVVVGLDISAAMLARAAARVARAGLDHVLLVRGDALSLPLADGAFGGVNCSGGIHQMPDLERALAEMARVASPGARFAASGFARDGEDERGARAWLRRRFALHVVPLARLARGAAGAGFAEVGARMSGPTMGYVWARRSGALAAGDDLTSLPKGTHLVDEGSKASPYASK